MKTSEGDRVVGFAVIVSADGDGPTQAAARADVPSTRGGHRFCEAVAKLLDEAEFDEKGEALRAQ